MTSVLIWHDQGGAYAAALARRGLPLDVAVARDETEFARLLADADILLGFRFPMAPLERRTRLRWIHVAAAGAEFLLPLRERLAAVTVTNSRGIHGAPIAEYAIAAMVMLHADFPGFLRAQAQRQWLRRPVPTLSGRTLGILGPGAIGSEIAQRACAFGMRVLGVSRSGRAVSGCEAVRTQGDLDHVLAECDFVAVTLPLTAGTRGLLDDRAFAAMKPGAFLVNASRGGVVDEQAMIRALLSGRLAGACVDVFETEPLPEDSPLWSMRNVILTPHITGMRDDYVERVLDIFADNLAAFESGRPMRNVFDLDRGY
ncbi:MAG: D-2-hydroxyacid dehydrogenase [Burkholderiales bacterium]